jgi:DNA-binding CsgD family transcriptional regulator
LHANGQIDWRQRWNARTGSIFACIENGDFGDALVAGLQEIVAFQHSVTFGYPKGRRPVFLHDTFSSDRRKGAVTAYLRGTYLVDPFYEACCRDIAPGLYRMEQLAPDEFFETVGGHPGYVSPCVSDEAGVLSEEIGYFTRTADRSYVVLSLMRDSGEPPFSESEMAILREIAPSVCLGLRSHFEASAAATPHLPPETLESAFNRFGGGLLTDREQQVSRMILRGHSTGSISQVLGIAVSTVKIHRRHIYAKLGVTSQAELFVKFLDSMLNGAGH